MYFDGISVGDSVYDRDGKEWKAIRLSEAYFIAIKDGVNVASGYDGTLAGLLILGQQFFWQPPPKIEIPGRPKRKVNKEGWISVYRRDNGEYILGCLNFDKQKEEKNHSASSYHHTIHDEWIEEE